MKFQILLDGQLQPDGKAVVQRDQWRWSRSFRFVSERASKKQTEAKSCSVQF